MVMHFVSPVFDLHSNYLLVNQGQTTATGLSTLVDGKLSHDTSTRSLHPGLRIGPALQPYAGNSLAAPRLRAPGLTLMADIAAK